jgi:hypothetical protein
MTGQMPPSVRDAYVGRFLVSPIEGGVEILFDGAMLMSIEKDDRLPEGFFDRLVRTIMDHLTGRKTALWDEQAIFGDRARDIAQVRAAGQAWADEQAAQRERTIADEPPQAQSSARSVPDDAEPDPTGCA